MRGIGSKESFLFGVILVLGFIRLCEVEGDSRAFSRKRSFDLATRSN